MSKQCPRCSSYNTERSVGGNIEYGIKAAARLGVAGAAFIAGNLLGPVAGIAGGMAILKGTESWTKNAKHFHCCKCGNDF